MILIGITGGVGSGKSEVLSYIEKTYSAKILLSDNVANLLKKPSYPCYEKVVELLGDGILSEDETIDNQKMAKAIFADSDLLAKVNAIIHPAVKQYIFDSIENAKKDEKYDFFFLEAALLIEEGFDQVVDEMWYVFANQDVRFDRLKKGRGYSDEKINSIIAKQLTEEEFRRKCGFVLDNSGDFKETIRLIDEKMGEYPCVKQK